MEKYLGVKLIEAEVMNLGDYNKFKGWTIPEDENPLREGYLVKYNDDYVSWSPREAFEEAYRPIKGLNYGLAVEALKKGLCVTRKGWNGKGLFICKQVPSEIYCNIIPKMSSLPQKAKDILFNRDKSIFYKDQMIIVKPDNTIDSWVASSSDTFAEDWEIVK